MEFLKLKPAYKDYLWGGDKLKKFFYKNCDFNTLAETWELSCHNDGNSIIENGKYKLKTLKEYIELENMKPLGENCKRFNDFPILIKLIDSKQALSVQVHPDDEYALKNENQFGKTEMWYVIDCEKDSFIYYGFKNKITKQEFIKQIKNGTLENILNKVNVKKGDIFFIEAGTIHAIGKGITIAEIQQNSNVTYRVYDYNRVDSFGNKRELHIDKAIDVTNLDFTGNKYDFGNYDVSCDIFNVNIIELNNQILNEYANKYSFHSILIVDGNGKIFNDNQALELKKGDSIFIPANIGKYNIEGNLKLIKTTIP